MSAGPSIERNPAKAIGAAWRRTRTSRHFAGKGADKPGQPLARSAYEDVVQSALWKTLFPKPLPQTRRDESEFAISSSWMHIHPASISRRALRFAATYGLGGLSAALFLVLLVTGILLMFFYVPAVDHAYRDMVDLSNVVSLGKLLRNMHRVAAHGMVIVVCLHMIRVFLHKAYTGPRTQNWMVGVCLLVVTLLLSFTGYLLPWDQLAYWAVTVGTNMAGAVPLIGEKIRYTLLGGYTVDQPALIRFYVLHCVFLPATMIVVMAYHFWRVRKDGFHGDRSDD